jgi:hypothetical protein
MDRAHSLRLLNAGATYGLKNHTGSLDDPASMVDCNAVLRYEHIDDF